MKQFDLALLKLAKLTLLGHTPKLTDFDFGHWTNNKSGCFVTAYHTIEEGAKSGNVWCCMSNGKYDESQSLPNNIIESAILCRTKDDRRSNSPPSMFSIDVLIPKKYWRQISPKQMLRDKNKTISVELTNGFSAIYLPSVWRERPDWTAQDFIYNLAIKANRGDSKVTVKTIYEIDTYEISEFEGIHDYEYLQHFTTPSMIGGSRGIDNSLITTMLHETWIFYNKYQKNNKLAYLIDEKGKVSFDNEGAMVRTLSDLCAYFKVGKFLSDSNSNSSSGSDSGSYVNKARKLVNSEIKRLRNKINYNDASDLAAWIELLITVDNGDNGNSKQYYSEICQNGEKLLNLQRSYGREGVFSQDLSFANPQALLALISVAQNLGCPNGVTSGMANPQMMSTINNFLALYQTKTIYHKTFVAEKESAAFAANWVTQALSATYQVSKLESIRQFVVGQMIPILVEAFNAKRSITQEATSAHAILAANKAGLINLEQIGVDFDNMVKRWAQLQQTWGKEQPWGNGGFRYYVDQPWYRTDVTSHVVEVLFLLL